MESRQMLTKDVRIILRENYKSVISEETVLWECPTCQKEMGHPITHQFYEDDASMTCNIWTNQCGHVARYDDIKLKRGNYFISFKEAQSHGICLDAFMQLKTIG